MKNLISIEIKKIKELEFSLNSSLSTTESEISFAVTTEAEVPNETFNFYIIYELKDSITEKVLLRIRTVNAFYVRGMRNFVSEDSLTVNLPDTTIIAMLSLSISHTRALLAKNTSGTEFESFYIPILNPTEMARQLFKKK